MISDRVWQEAMLCGGQAEAEFTDIFCSSFSFFDPEHSIIAALRLNLSSASFALLLLFFMFDVFFK